MSLEVRPITLRAANAFVAEHHRHNQEARGCVFCSSVVEGERLAGVLIVGRPSARMLDTGLTCEVVRCCTDGTRNACSKLYAVAARTAATLGYRRIITYTLPDEGGASLRASGWTFEEALAGGGVWTSGKTSQSKRREKWRWQLELV